MCYRGKLLNTHWSHKGWSAPASETQFVWWSMTHGKIVMLIKIMAKYCDPALIDCDAEAID